ncbi:MAG: hypothetical protein GX879_01835 [Bacteroidales bacterium]|nr:hypothetical protein [Bacteroidales bacterium]
MKKEFFIVAVALLLGCFAFNSCKPDDPSPDEGAILEEFIGVKFDIDTIQYLDTTRIVANAKGKNLVFQWETSSNAPLIPIEGVDTAVLFYADPCLNPGVKYVYCTVIADNAKQTKMDSIVLVP